MVDPVSPDGRQVFHRFVDPRGSMDTTFAFRPDGIFLVSTVIGAGAGGGAAGAGAPGGVTCTFDPPVPTPPWPPSVGARFSGHGECGLFAADLDGTVDATRRASLDGAALEVFVVTTRLTTHGGVESTATQVDWFAPSERLITHTESHASGTAGPFAFGSELSADLVSARPA